MIDETTKDNYTCYVFYTIDKENKKKYLYCKEAANIFYWGDVNTNLDYAKLFYKTDIDEAKCFYNMKATYNFFWNIDNVFIEKITCDNDNLSVDNVYIIKNVRNLTTKLKEFVVGNYYEHNSGSLLHIVAEATTTFYGKALIAENNFGELIPINRFETFNYHEVSLDRWKEATRDKDDSDYVDMINMSIE